MRYIVEQDALWVYILAVVISRKPVVDLEYFGGAGKTRATERPMIHWPRHTFSLVAQPRTIRNGASGVGRTPENWSPCRDFPHATHPSFNATWSNHRESRQLTLWLPRRPDQGPFSRILHGTGWDERTLCNLRLA